MGAEQSEGDTRVVYVPARPLTEGGRKDVAFELRQLETGEQAAIAFTSVPRLVNALGKRQPWLAMPLGKLREVVGARGIARVAVDPVVPASAWRWAADR